MNVIIFMSRHRILGTSRHSLLISVITIYFAQKPNSIVNMHEQIKVNNLKKAGKWMSL